MSSVRPTKLILVTSLAVASLALTACGSSTPAPATVHPAGVPYLSRAGTGDATLPQVALPGSWSLVWHFNCTDPASRRSFVLTATPSGGMTTQVTDQTGLEGGGYRPFRAAGDYTFVVTTTCGWNVLAGTAGTQVIPTTVPGAASG